MTQRARTLIETGYLVLLAMIVAVPIVGVVQWFIAALPFPYSLDYNEGIVWKQMAEIVAGRGYAPIDGFPAIVFHYPPVFHLAAAALAQAGVDPLVAGRLVSLASTAGSALIIADLARRLIPENRPPTGGAAMPERRRLFSGIGMVSAIVIFLLFEAVHIWAPQMRVDAIACFFALAGLWCVTKSDERPALVYLAAVFFTLSVFSKQVSIVAAAASFGALLLLRPRRAIHAIGVTVLLGLLGLGVLVWLTQGEAFRHLFLYNINRFDLVWLIPNFKGGLRTDQPLLVVGAIGYILVLMDALSARRRGSPPDLTTATMLLFMPIATLSLVMTAKTGSSSSYYLQWDAGLAVFGGVAVAALLRIASEQLANGSPLRASGWAAIPLALAFWALHYDDPSHRAWLEAKEGENRTIVRLLEPAKGDIIADDMAILMRMHRNVVWEPAIFAELARMGRWDEQLVIEQFRNHRIGAAMTDGDRGDRIFEERYNPAVADAMDAALPRKIRFGSRVVHLPAAVSPAPAPLVSADAAIRGTPSAVAGQR